MWKPLERFRLIWDGALRALAGARARLLLATLGLISGVLVGGIVILFRWVIETAQSAMLPGADPENYEALDAALRFLLSLSGGLVLGLMYLLVARTPLRVGVIHVMERLAYHEGYLPVKNALVQFIGGAISIIAGHSVGREGPSIHLGAAGASLMGQWLRLPNNSIRTLVACGVAAAIAASFNTPLAGVIFAMEVVVMEYTISGFAPVILSAVSATALNRIIFDVHPAFHVPQMQLASFWELPAIAVMGFYIGALAALFIFLLKKFTELGQRLPVWAQMTAAGAGVGLCALLLPEVMSIGYDTVNTALLGDIVLASLAGILFIKLLATAMCIGFNLPAGLIGPTLFMGAMAGGIAGQLMQNAPGPVSHVGLYTMLGMGAMMGATLQAPLAALLALMELTGNVNIIFPGMLAIITASLTATELFGQGSVYLSQSRWIGLDYRYDPVSQSLRRLAVSSILDESFIVLKSQVNRDHAQKVLSESKPRWLVLSRENGNLLLPAADLARYLEETQEEEIDLMEIPGKRQQLMRVPYQSTLQQALDILDQSEADAIYVVRPLGFAAERIYGVATRKDITEAYHLKGSSHFY